MQFYYPNILWGLFAVAIPIIIHLFNFRRFKVIYFSNVSFLQQLEKDTKSRSKLQDLLILLARILIVALLVLLFARPYIPTGGVEHSENNYVSLYIDNSLSMEVQGETVTLLDVAKSRAISIVNGFSSNTRFNLITNNFELKHHQWVNKSQCLRWIAEIDYNNYPRDFVEIFKRHKLVFEKEEAAKNTSLFYISDFQQINFQHEVNVYDTLTSIYALPIQQQGIGNVLIDSVWFESPGHYQGKIENLQVRIKNYSENSIAAEDIKLFINDSVKAMGTYSIEPFQSTTITLSFLQGSLGFQKGKLELTDYPVTFDNVLYFAYNVAPAIKVAIIEGESDSRYFNAMFKNDKNFEYHSFVQNNLSFDKLGKSHFWVLNQLHNVSSGLAYAAEKFVNNGGTILAIMPEQMDNKRWEHFLNKMQVPQVNQWVNQKGQLSEVNFKHILLDKAVQLGNEKINYPGYEGFYSLRNNTSKIYNTICSSESGEPILIEKSKNKGTFYLSLLPFNDSVTDINTHPIIVPLVYNSALNSNRTGELYHVMAPGMLLYFKSPEIVEKVEIEGQTNMINFRNQGNGFVVYPEIDLLTTGHVRFLTEKGGYWAGLNIDRKESDLSVFSADKIIDFFKANGFGQVKLLENSETSIKKGLLEMEQGRDLSNILLLFLLLLLISEQVFVRLLKKKNIG
jgi:hypothetical protein